jgi:hypothetical protein
MQALIHHIYTSAAQGMSDSEALQRILVQSRRNNAPLGITGMLLHTAGSFFQILEGSPEAVTALFTRIAADPRHQRITTIIREPIPRRAFPDWTMGFAEISPPELARLIGSNDFFGNRQCLSALDQGRSRKLLAAFAQGRWLQPQAKLSRPAPA